MEHIDSDVAAVALSVLEALDALDEMLSDEQTEFSSRYLAVVAAGHLETAFATLRQRHAAAGTTQPKG